MSASETTTPAPAAGADRVTKTTVERDGKVVSVTVAFNRAILTYDAETTYISDDDGTRLFVDYAKELAVALPLILAEADRLAAPPRQGECPTCRKVRNESVNANADVCPTCGLIGLEPAPATADAPAESVQPRVSWESIGTRPARIPADAPAATSGAGAGEGETPVGARYFVETRGSGRIAWRVVGDAVEFHAGGRWVRRAARSVEDMNWEAKLGRLKPVDCEGVALGLCLLTK